MTPKLCYILPKYDPNSPEHFYHIYDFLGRLAQQIDLCVIFEQAAAAPSLPGVRCVYAQRFGYPLRLLETLATVLRAHRHGYRLFYVHYSYAGAIWAGAVTRLLGGRTFYWHCGLIGMFFRSWAFDGRTISEKLTNEWPFRLSLRAAHRLVTGTVSMARYYAGEFGVAHDRIIVLPNEIDLTRFAQADREAERARLGVADRQVVLFVHRLSPRKGADLLPEIVRQTVALRPQAMFVVAGDGPVRTEAQQALAEAGLASYVRFLGWVANRDVAALYAAADLFIMPSREEAFPRVLLEAMATGTPFVGTDVGGVRDICAPEQWAWLVPPGDPGRFASAVVELLSRDDLRAALAAAGRVHVAQYDQPAVAQVFVQRILGTSG